MGLDIKDFLKGRGDLLFLALGCYQMWSLLKRWLVNSPTSEAIFTPLSGYIVSEATEALAALAVALVLLLVARAQRGRAGLSGGAGAEGAELAGAEGAGAGGAGSALSRVPDIPWPVLLALGALPAVSDILGAAGSRGAMVAVLAACSLVQVWCYTACVCLYSRLSARRAVFFILLSYALSAALRFPFELLPPLVVDILFTPMPMACCLMCRRANGLLDAGEAGPGGAPEPRKATLSRPAQRSWPTYALIVVAFGFAVGTCCRSVVTSGFSGTEMFLMYCAQVLLPLAILAVLLGTHESLRVIYVCQLMFTLILATVILLSIGAAGMGHALQAVSYLSRYFVRMFFIATVTMIIIDGARRDAGVFFCLSYALLYGSIALGNVLGRAAELSSGSASALYLAVAFALSVVMVVVSSIDMLRRDDPLLFVEPAATSESLSQEEEIGRRCRELAEQHRLTAREETIASLICLGRSKRYIAEHLVISENTVRGYAKQLYKKLGIHSKEELEALVMGAGAEERAAR